MGISTSSLEWSPEAILRWCRMLVALLRMIRVILQKPCFGERLSQEKEDHAFICVEVILGEFSRSERVQ